MIHNFCGLCVKVRHLEPGRRIIAILNETSQPVEISSEDLTASHLIRKVPALSSLGVHDLNSIIDDLRWGTGRVVALDPKYVKKGDFTFDKKYEILVEIGGGNSPAVNAPRSTYMVEDDRGVIHHVESHCCLLS